MASRDPHDRRQPSANFWSGYDILWGLADQPASRTPLDRDRIVTAAIALADAEGLDAVSMRRVAASVGRGAMSLYRHVPDKDALLSMMIERIVGETIAAAADTLPPSDWRTGLALIARSTWKLAREHPWYPMASMTRPPLTPSSVAGLELALSLFDHFPIDIGTKMQFVGAVHFSVLMAALNTTIEQQTLARTNMSDDEVMAAAVPFMSRMVESGRFPRVAEFVLSADHDDDETQMWKGVELILDGIAARLSAGRPTTGSSASRQG